MRDYFNNSVDNIWEAKKEGGACNKETNRQTGSQKGKKSIEKEGDAYWKEEDLLIVLWNHNKEHVFTEK